MKIEPKPSGTKHFSITKNNIVVKVESKSNEITIVAIENVCIEMKVKLDSNKWKIATIDKEYKKKFNKYLYYQWVQKTQKSSNRNCKFQHVQVNCNLRFKFTVCKTITYDHLVWEYFVHFFNLISKFWKIEWHVHEIHLELIKLLHVVGLILRKTRAYLLLGLNVKL